MTAAGVLTGTFTLTATGGPVKFSVVDPSAPSDGVSVSPGTGTIKDGGKQTVTVTVDDANGGFSLASLTVSPDVGTITAFYSPPT